PVPSDPPHAASPIPPAHPPPEQPRAPLPPPRPPPPARLRPDYFARCVLAGPVSLSSPMSCGVCQRLPPPGPKNEVSDLYRQRRCEGRRRHDGFSRTGKRGANGADHPRLARVLPDDGAGRLLLPPVRRGPGIPAPGRAPVGHRVLPPRHPAEPGRRAPPVHPLPGPLPDGRTQPPAHGAGAGRRARPPARP